MLALGSEFCCMWLGAKQRLGFYSKCSLLVHRYGSHLVLPLAEGFECGICLPVEAVGHLEGLDVLSSAHATGPLGDYACQPHLLLQINL